MNILDESILESQRQLILYWRMPLRQIGYDIGRKGLHDREIITLLLQQRRITFFTPDSDFYERALCHSKYCLVHLDVRKHEVAIFIRRFLRHQDFNTVAKRMGKVVQISSAGIRVCHRHADREMRFEWNR